MKIEFFETEKGFDTRAIEGGVYHVELLRMGKEDKPISLYIGESVWIAHRCSDHLYSLWDDSSYFGLTDDDLKNDNLILRFSVLDEIEGKKSILGVGKYKDKELVHIRDKNPLTQLMTSDRQLDKQEKRQKVHNKMIEQGFFD